MSGIAVLLIILAVIIVIAAVLYVARSRRRGKVLISSGRSTPRSGSGS